LEGEDGIALDRIAGVLPSLFSLGLAGCAFPIGEQLDLPQRHAASEHAADHHPDEGQHGLPHRCIPLICVQALAAHLRPGRDSSGGQRSNNQEDRTKP
jgi:hypothetical protein